MIDLPYLQTNLQLNYNYLTQQLPPLAKNTPFAYMTLKLEETAMGNIPPWATFRRIPHLKCINTCNKQCYNASIIMFETPLTGND